MTISVKDAANIINYLYAAQAITVTDNQHAVWADYINSEMPELQPRDIPASARRAIKDWSQHGRAWKVDPQQFVNAARAIRRERLGRFQLPTAPSDIESNEYRPYMDRYNLAISDGESPETADRLARELVGRPAPAEPATLTGPPTHLQQLITRFKESA